MQMVDVAEPLIGGVTKPTQDRLVDFSVRFRSSAEIPAETPVSRAMSKELAGRGFKFCGPTIVYAFMQATGMVNDHVVKCYRHAALAQPAARR